MVENMQEVKIYDELIGKTFSKVYKSGIEGGDDELIFETENGDKYIFNHYQDCCENVYIKEIVGDLSDLENSPILKAEEIINTDSLEIDSKFPDCRDSYDSVTWTFYKFATNKGSVDVSWIGTSNGYYSESVGFKVQTKEAVEKRRIEDLQRRHDYLEGLTKSQKALIQDKILEKQDINHSLGQILDFLQDKNSNNDLIAVRNAVQDLYNKTEIKKTYISG